jgi:serine/threonine protein kinase
MQAHRAALSCVRPPLAVAWRRQLLNPAPIPRTKTLIPGSIIDQRYEILSLVAEGGMGFIYKARQLPLGRVVALKVLRKELAHDEASIKRFSREAKTISQLAHPDIITLFDYGIDPDGQMYLVVEWLDGADLADVLAAEGSIEPIRASRIAMITARSLAAAHRKGVIHRDLKPENIFIIQRHDDGEDERIKVLDFGIAKLINEDDNEVRITKMGAVCGTPEFMSPEQARGEPLDGRSDLYALGCLLYTMLVGALPFEHESVYQLLLMHQRHAFPLLHPSLPRELNDIIQRATRKLRDERFSSADEMADALESFFRRESELARLISMAPPDEDFSDTQVIGHIPLLHAAHQAPLSAPSSPAIPPAPAAAPAFAQHELTHILKPMDFPPPINALPPPPAPPRHSQADSPTIQANLRDLVRTSTLPPVPPPGLVLTPKILAVSVAILSIVVILMVAFLLNR